MKQVKKVLKGSKAPPVKKGKKKVPTKGRAQAPRSKGKPFRLEVGKTYMSREGFKRGPIKVTTTTLKTGWPFTDGVFTYRLNGTQGLTQDMEYPGDLIKLVPSPKGVKR